MIRRRGCSCTYSTHILIRRMQSRATNYPRNLLPNDAHPHSTAPAVLLYIYIYIYLQLQRANLSGNFPLRPLPQSPSPVVRTPSCFSKGTNVERIRSKKRMIKPRQEPLGRHRNRILLPALRRRLACRSITMYTHTRSRKEGLASSRRRPGTTKNHATI